MVLLIMVLTRKTKPKVTAYKKTIPTCRSSKKLTKQQMLYELKKKGMILPLRTTKAVVKQLHVFAGNGNFNKHAQRDDSSSIRSSPAGSWPLFVSRTVANLDDDEDTTEMNVTKIAPRTYTLYNCINSKARGGTGNTSINITEYVTPLLWKAICVGRDVSLHHFSMSAETATAQYHDDHKDVSSSTFKQFDPRLLKSLSLSKFVLTFVKFLNIMCDVHPERREELTHYLSFIVKLATTFPPPLSFEYRKQFSSKAAAILSTSGVKTD
ncbi:unnamed protein product [Didymodactylos carnosus]|uniref:Uncharacterized protein n=1 Tax=Didymodactylos carnosus TaxID=1234261 RepID=A0A8S2EB92_9BILA|nr:unnamed protein product [Didymodactylos carnosus]CAF3904640.1 unnamed protein product [Didymodactylos carnosus]